MENDLKVLMIWRDRNILVHGSVVSERMKEYGALVKELHIVLLSDSSHGLNKAQLAKKVWVYPTNSLTSFLRPFNAARLGKKIVFDNKFVRGRSVITTQDPFECGWAGLKVKKKWRLPLEVQLHTDPFSPYFSGFLNSLRKRIARKVLHHADSIRVVTEGLRSKISKQLKIENSKLKILPIYVDKKKIEEGRVAFDLHARYGWHFILLTVSRLSPEKNLALALAVLARVRERFKDTGLVIVGSGPEENHLKALVKKFKLEGAVEFVGWQNDLASFYKTANVFVQTSFFEGYGLSLIEAGLYGLPIITTPVGIAQELEHGKDAFIYPVGNPELFAQGVVDLIENNYKRENLRTNMKHTLDIKLISRADYLAQIKDDWASIATNIK